MNGRKVTGRFFLFLVVLCVVVFFIVRPFISFGVKDALVVSASTSEMKRVQGVIVRDEPVTTADGNSTVIFVSEEGTQIAVGDEVADVYSAAYSTKEMERLETIRQDIRAYHKTILKDIVDAELDRLDANVGYKALEMKTLVNRKASGSILNVTKQLTEAMEDRQSYLSQNRREDSKLNALYEEESKRQTSIASWKSAQTAQTAGTVSFYLDGYEQYLTPERMDTLSADDLRNVIAGIKVDTENSSRLTTPVYRIVNNDKWYMLLIIRDGEFNSMTGQTYSFQLEGFDDVIYSGTVTQVQTYGSDTVVALQVSDPMGPLINQRSGYVSVGAELEGLYVPTAALVSENGQTGVLINDQMSGTFVPVQILSRDKSGVLVKPVVDGSLLPGSRVLLK